MRDGKFSSRFRFGEIVQLNKSGLEAVYPSRGIGRTMTWRELAEKRRFIVVGIDTHSSMIDHVCIWVVNVGRGTSRSSWYEGFLESVSDEERRNLEMETRNE
jgi:aconitase A